MKLNAQDNKDYLDALHAYPLARDAYTGIDDAIIVKCWWSSAVVYIKLIDDIQYVIFRGTDKLPDWMFNIFAIPVKYRNTWMHAGFAIVHKSIWKKVLKYVDLTHHTVFIGHSLGGAVAEVSAYTAFIDKFKSVGGIFFGKPNVFHKLAKLNFPLCLGRLLSVVNPCDPITMIPKIMYTPHSLQTKLVLTKGGHVVYLNPRKSFIDRLIKLDDIKNHKMSEYGYRLENAKEIVIKEAT